MALVMKQGTGRNVYDVLAIYYMLNGFISLTVVYLL